MWMNNERLFTFPGLMEVDANQGLWKGPDNELLNFDLDAKFEPKIIQSRKPTLWRYKEALPSIHEKDIVSVDEGFTPMLPLTFKTQKIWIKQDQLFQTGSYKDRGATILISKVKSLGIRHIVQDSSGNAGAAIACYAAMAKISCDIYVPSITSGAKIKQIEAYGAKIHLVNGDREDTARTALLAAEKSYYASHCYNPYFFQGTKTLAFEITEQLGWKCPETIVLPLGNGTLVLGCYIGFMDLLKAGITNKLPKIIAIQSENCAPVFHAFTNTKGTYSATIAEGIAVQNPVRLKQILDAIQQTNGLVLTVNELEIKDALQECAREGFYIEPTAAATIAGVNKYLTGYNAGTLVTLFSGHGLKK